MERGREPVTKQDIVNAEERIMEAMRDIQTETLKAFFSLADSHMARLSQAEHEAEFLKERMGILERRITELERKAGFPGHPIQ